MALIGEMNYLTVDGSTYEIADAAERNQTLTATYTSETEDLEITFTSAANADNEEF